MYTANIVVKFTMDGVHRWEDCDIDEVSFLRNQHHHTFHFECTKKVSHDDRDIELIAFKRKIEKWLRDNFYSELTNCLDFDQMSCEMIAKRLSFIFNLDKCSVYEDGTVGAEVTKKDLNFNYDIIVVCGETASGKHHFIENQIKADGINTHIISVSDIVKRLSNESNRSKLSDTASLVPAIEQSILEALSLQVTALNTRVIVDGIRQPKLLKAIMDFDDKEMTLLHLKKFIYLDVPFQTRVDRFMQRENLHNREDSENLLKSIDKKHAENYEFYRVEKLIRTNESDKLSPHSFQIIKYY